jgi:hypothetical protein
MELSCRVAVGATAVEVWPYYAEVEKRKQWELELEELRFDGGLKAGATGHMRLTGMPELTFTVTAAEPDRLYRDCTTLPLGELCFGFAITREGDQTYITHSVALDGPNLGEQGVAMLSSIFAGVPEQVLRLRSLLEG